MGYDCVSLDELDPYDVEGIDPHLLPIGPELRPDEMRPSVWEYDEGESNNRHYQETQEELYVPLSGTFELSVDDETTELSTGDVVVVEPSAERQLTALSDASILVVGAPSVPDDGVVVE